MTLVLVRHGETALNAARTLQPFDTPLSARGLAQAAAVARRLAPMGLAGIVCSDQPRALQTAEALGAATGLPLQTTPLLQERNFGDLRGRPYDTLGFDPLAMEAAPPGGESIPDFAARIAAAFAHVVRLRAALGGPLAVVSHGLVIRGMLERHLQAAPGFEMPDRIGNTAVSIAAATPPHEALLVNCVAHLGGAVAEDGRSLSGG